MPGGLSLDFTLVLTFIALVVPALDGKPGVTAALVAGVAAVLGYGLAPLAAVELGAAVAGEGHGLREGLVILSLLVWPVLIWMSFRVAGKTHLVQIQ